jgi:hypothetical protein
MSTQPQIADPETEQTVNVIDRLNEENAATEQQRDAAAAEVARLKRTYEPDDGIIIDKLLKLTDFHEESFMRVTVRTGGCLSFELAKPARPLLYHTPAWSFRPTLEGKCRHKHDFSGYGMHTLHLGGSGEHNWLVTFTEPATVEITVVTDHNGYDDTVLDKPSMTIEEVTQAPTVTLTAGKRARTDH